MSKLSVWLHQVADFVKDAAHNAPSDQQNAVADVVVALRGAGDAIEHALPTLAKLVIDAGLAAIGYGKYIPDMNSFLDLMIAELQSRKTTTGVNQPPNL